MRVEVLCFGVLRSLLGWERQSVMLHAKATVGELVRRLRATSGEAVWDRLAVAVNREFATPDRILCEGDEVALLPPVSGGVR